MQGKANKHNMNSLFKARQKGWIFRYKKPWWNASSWQTTPFFQTFFSETFPLMYPLQMNLDKRPLLLDCLLYLWNNSNDDRNKCNDNKKNDCTHHDHLIIIFIRWVLSVVGWGVGTYWMCKSLLCYSRTLMTAKVVLREGSSLVMGALTWSYQERFLTKCFHTFLTKWSEEGWSLVYLLDRNAFTIL